MAEVNTPDVCGKNSSNKTNPLIDNQSTNAKMNDHSTCQKEKSIDAQTEMKSDYLENLLDSSVDDWNKGNLKEKVVPHLQEDDYQNKGTISSSGENMGTPSYEHIDSSKIQNIEPSITASPMSVNISADADGTENTVMDIVDTSIQNSNNTSNLLNQSQQNNLEQKNGSLQLICNYGSDSDDDDDDDLYTVPHSNNILGPSGDADKDAMDYRTAQVFFSEDSEDDSDSSDDKSESDSSSTTSSSSSSSSSASVPTENASAVRIRNVNNAQNNATKSSKKNNSLMTRGELAIEDLPPIEDLFISVPEEECVELGKVTNIVDQLVVVQANKNTPPLDLDSVLFLDHGKQALGQVFDVFGQVTEPLYCIRFNSRDHIKERGIERDMTVYCAPKTPHTSYVFMSHLMNVKGSDASWEHNNEPPPKCLDYSDDEEERRARRSLKSGDKKATDEGPEYPKKKKVRSNSFERRMNERNLRMTALHANQPPTPTIKNTASLNNSTSTSNNNNNNGVPRPPFENGGAWWSGPLLPSNHTFHRPNRPPPPPCNPSPQRLIHPPTFTLPPPQRFDIPPYPVFSSPHPSPQAFSSPRAGPSMPPMFPPPFQGTPFLPFNHTFSPPIPPFNPNRPPPNFGFPPAFPPQMPRHRPPP